MMFPERVTILGTEYSIRVAPDAEVCDTMGCPLGECGGYCDAYTHEIVIAELDEFKDDDACRCELKRTNLRHEVVHAYLNESGLGPNASRTECWAKNEEMVDWIAIQAPKMFRTFAELGIS